MFRNSIKIYSQSEPYFSDGITAPYVEAYEEIEFPKIMYVYDDGNPYYWSVLQLLMSLIKHLVM
jgi:hypothetical protein